MMRTRWWVLCLCLVEGGANANTPSEVEIGGTLRDVPMNDLSGASRKFSDYRGVPLR